MSAEAIFVFGSNLSGRHGRGAALRAREHHGAVSGKGVGRHGRSYAIPTKDHALRGLPLDQIAHYVLINALMADALVLLSEEPAGDLFGTPVLTQELFDQSPSHGGNARSITLLFAGSSQPSRPVWDDSHAARAHALVRAR